MGGQEGQQRNKETGFSISGVRTVRVQVVGSERTLDIGKARKLYQAFLVWEGMGMSGVVVWASW